jgi:hypothetical protein
VRTTEERIARFIVETKESLHRPIHDDAGLTLERDVVRRARELHVDQVPDIRQAMAAVAA